MKKFNRFKKHFPKLSSGEILKKIKKTGNTGFSKTVSP